MMLKKQPFYWYIGKQLEREYLSYREKHKINFFYFVHKHGDSL